MKRVNIFQQNEIFWQEKRDAWCTTGVFIRDGSSSYTYYPAWVNELEELYFFSPEIQILSNAASFSGSQLSNHFKSHFEILSL